MMFFSIINRKTKFMTQEKRKLLPRIDFKIRAMGFCY
jgi:hypothetical protein